MEDISVMSNIGYNIGKKAKLHEFEILALLEMIKHDQHYDFFKRILSIAKSVKVSIPEQLYKYDYENFEIYIQAMLEGLMKSCSTLKIEAY